MHISEKLDKTASWKLGTCISELACQF